MSERRTAQFSDDRLYRYSLTIRWSDEPLTQFIGLNPSTADEVQDDPTIRRCKAFAKSIGSGGIIMTNLFAWRSTDPAALKTVPNPIGETGTFITVGNVEFGNRNDFYLYVSAMMCQVRIACWGVHGTLLYRAIKVKQFMPELKCLKKTRGGHPSHPLYLRGDLRPVPL